MHQYLLGTTQLESSLAEKRCPVPGPEAMGTNWITGGSLWASGNTFLLWGWPSTGAGYTEILWSLHLEIFISCLGMVLGNWLSMTLLEQGGWSRWPSEVPSNINYSVILWLCDSHLEDCRVPSLIGQDIYTKLSTCTGSEHKADLLWLFPDVGVFSWTKPTSDIAQNSIPLQMICMSNMNVDRYASPFAWNSLQSWAVRCVCSCPVRALAARKYTQFRSSGFISLMWHYRCDLCHLLVTSLPTQSNIITTVQDLLAHF